MTRDLEVLCQDYLPAALQPELERNGVAKTVLVQASNSVAESRWLLRLADKHDFISAVVGWVDLISPAVDSQLDELTKHPKFKGVRHLVESEPAVDWLVQPQVLQGLRRLADFGLSYDLLVHTRHLKYVPRVAEHCPQLSLVIDHLAKPPIARQEIREWAEQLRPVAAFQNIYCKLSGLVTEANWAEWQTRDLRPYVEYALEIFGSDRLLFGSDHPVCLLAASYERVLDSFREILASLPGEEQEKIFWRNAASFYRLM